MTIDLAALLIVKGHSSRVPGKNFRSLGGRPLFTWVIETLRSIPEIDRIVIDTDARETLLAAGLQEDGRLSLRDRNPALLGDRVTATPLLADMLPAVPARSYLMTHVTNPFLGAETIRRGIAAYRAAVAAGTGDALIGVTEHRARFFRADGAPLNHDPAALRPTQELEILFEENSNLYLFSAESFARAGHRNGLRPVLFPIPRDESLDIDDGEDWRLAERVAAGIARRGHG